VRWSTVYLGLRDAILTHSIEPGTKLPEDELGEIYSVSRTIVRSALQALAHDRLVTLEPNRGAFVAKPTKLEAREVFEARALIEPKVAGLAAEVAKPADIALLRHHLEEEHEALHAGRDGEAVVLSGRFHVAIAEIAGDGTAVERRRFCIVGSASGYRGDRDTVVQVAKNGREGKRGVIFQRECRHDHGVKVPGRSRGKTSRDDEGKARRPRGHATTLGRGLELTGELSSSWVHQANRAQPANVVPRIFWARSVESLSRCLQACQSLKSAAGLHLGEEAGSVLGKSGRDLHWPRV